MDPTDSSREALLNGLPIKFQPGAPEAQRTIRAEWIVKAVSKSLRVEIHNAIISGPLMLNARTIDAAFVLDGCDVIDDAEFLDARFTKNLFLSGTVFHKNADFSGVKFDGKTLLTGAVFRGEANFATCRARDLIVFNKVLFEGKVLFFRFHAARDLVFTDARFRRPDQPAMFTFLKIDGAAFLSKCLFAGDAQFYGARITGEAHFTGSQFKGRASLRKAECIGNARFEQVIFSDEADFSGAQFGGDAQFEGTKFQCVNNAARFDAVTVRGVAGFVGAVFSGAALFRSAHIGSQAQFLGARFAAAFSLNGARIEGNALFGSEGLQNVSPAQFEGEADFASANFGRNAEFDGVAFQGRTIFEHAVICGPALFRKARFCVDSEPDFYATKFGSGALFLEAEFPDKADFRSAEFLGETSFQGSKFHGEVRFDGSRFAGLVGFGRGLSTKPASFEKVSFNHARFEQDAWFNATIFKGTVSFREASFRMVHFSATGKVDEAAQFESGVDLRGCRYDGIEVSWESLCRQANGAPRLEPYDRQPYVQLEQTFRVLGRDDEADGVYLERRRVEHQRKRGIAKFFDWLYWRGANYGVKPYQLFWLTIIVIAWGTLCFQFYGAVRPELSAKTPSSPVDTACPLNLSLAESARISLREFMPIELPILRDCHPSEKRWCLLRFSDWAAILRLMGWIIVPVGVAALTGLLRLTAPSRISDS